MGDELSPVKRALIEIRELRARCGLTQAAFGALIHASLRAVQNYEGGFTHFGPWSSAAYIEHADIVARSLVTGGSLAELVEAGHAARVSYDNFSRPDILTVRIGAPDWRSELAAAGRAGGVIRSALPAPDSRR